MVSDNSIGDWQIKMTDLNQLKAAFLIVRRNYKQATQSDEMYGGRFKQTKMAWDEFESLLDEFITHTTGVGINTRIIKRRGYEGMRDLEGNCADLQKECSDSEELALQNQTTLLP